VTLLLPLWVPTDPDAYPPSELRLGAAVALRREAAAGPPLTSGIRVRSGIIGQRSLHVSATTTPSSSVRIAPGQAVVQGSGAAQGAYVITSTAEETRDVGAADASLPTKAIVYARVYDEDDGVDDGNPATDPFRWEIEVLRGTPAAAPLAPALPTDALLLATVTLPAADSTYADADIADGRQHTTAAGGVLPTVLATVPADPYPGEMVCRTDILGTTLEMFDGAAWQRIFERRIWNDPTLSSPWAAYNTGIYPTLGYSVRDGILSLRGVIKSTASTAANATIATLPVGARPAYRVALIVPGPANVLERVDILTSGIIAVQAANAALSSLLFDNINVPLG